MRAKVGLELGVRIGHTHPMMEVPPNTETGQRDLDLSWLVRLRWAAAAGQAISIMIAAWILDMPLPTASLLGVVALGAATNLVLQKWKKAARPTGSPQIAAVMATDILVLTGLLALSGGPANPFSTLYLVNVALATIILRPAWVWALVAFTTICFAFLFLASPSHGHHMAMAGSLHLQGMWLALTLGAGFIAYFGNRIQKILQSRSAQLAAARDAAARADRLAALTTLAAGAAHELATPLSTIAIAAKELQRGLADRPDETGPLEDSHLIRDEVERCRTILARLSARSEDPISGRLDSCTVKELLETALIEIPEIPRIQIQMTDQVSASQVRLPREAIGQALRSVTRNSLQASLDGSEIRIECLRDADQISIEIQDQGCGMTEDVAQRASEPFFTTRPNGEGMGLGLFLARSVVERIGGSLEIRSSLGKGTSTTMHLPVEAIEVIPQ